MQVKKILQVSMKHSLEVYAKDKLVFYHDGKWLYPLFELEQFLKSRDFSPSDLYAHDKIIGRAAALFLIKLGFRSLYAGVLSERGKEILDRYDVSYEYNALVDRIDCKTEDLLFNEFDPDKAYQILRKRAKLDDNIL